MQNKQIKTNNVEEKEKDNEHEKDNGNATENEMINKTKLQTQKSLGKRRNIQITFKQTDNEKKRNLKHIKKTEYK